jgi:hypothetical protein
MMVSDLRTLTGASTGTSASSRQLHIPSSQSKRYDMFKHYSYSLLSFNFKFILTYTLLKIPKIISPKIKEIEDNFLQATKSTQQP